MPGNGGAVGVGWLVLGVVGESGKHYWAVRVGCLGLGVRLGAGAN